MMLLAVFIAYVALLFLISRITARNAGGRSFFRGDRKAPWPIVAYGMVGASVSGVTFISVPGNVLAQNFYYVPMVIGFCLGYAVVAHLLLPVYYRMNLTSIYSYLGERFGTVSHRTGSAVFMISRLLGAAVRVFIVILVLFTFIPPELFEKIPEVWAFSAAAFIFLVLLYLYTCRGGVKTIIWTDVLQTTIMIAALLFAIWAICREMDWTFSSMISAVSSSGYSRMWDTDWSSGTNVVKQIVAGIFMTVTMTGMDQGMMQKNLACKDLRSAQKNMYSTAGIIFIVNVFFLCLGAILAIYADRLGGMSVLGIEKTDQLFPVIAGDHLGTAAGILFILGLISASYPSAGAAMTSLTTSFCVDFMDFERREDLDERKKSRIRMKVQAGISLLFLAMMVLLFLLNDDAVINLVYKLASYTYGPLLGLFTFGIFTHMKVRDRATPFIALSAPLLCALANHLLKAGSGFDLGFSLLLVNGLLTFIGLCLFSVRGQD